MILKRLSDNSDLTLSNNFVWVDEFDYTPITQETSYTLGGNFIINDAAAADSLKGGRKITLESGDGVGVTRVDMLALQTLAGLPSEYFQITLPDGTVKNVIFDKMNNPISGVPLTRINSIPDNHPYTNVKIKFLEATSV